MGSIELDDLQDGAVEEIALTQSSSEDNADIMKSHQDLSWKSFFNEYYSVIRYNPQFRYLWLSTVVSLIGDWLNEIGCITILNEMSDSGTLVSLYMVSRELPALIWNPVVGVVVDTFDRKKILIIADLLRAAIVLLFLLVRPLNSIWLLYILAFLQFTVTSFFNPAMESMVPSVVTSKELLAANSLLGLTWSGMLMLGAALGGAITYSLGTTADFIADSLSYLLSAALFFRLLSLKQRQKGFSQLQEEPEEQKQEEEEAEPHVGAWQKYKDGLTFLWKNKYYLCIATAKGFGSFVWSVIEVVIIKVSSTYYKIGGDSSLSLSILYITTGFGVCIGPMITKRLFRDNEHNNRWLLVYGYFAICVGTLVMAIPMTFPIFAIINFFRATGSSTVWVYSSVILQRGVPDKMLGRVFAFEFAAATLMSVLARLSFGLLYDSWGLSPIQITLLYGIIAGVVLLIWFIGVLWLTRKERNTAKNIVLDETETVPIE